MLFRSMEISKNNKRKTRDQNPENGHVLSSSVGSLTSNPHYDDIDTSDEEDLRNTIGNVPLKWYEDYDHIGYDLDGRKIAKPAGTGNKDELDEFLNRMDNPDYWRSVIDQQTGAKIVLSDEDIEVIRRLTQGKYGRGDTEEFDTSSWFTQDEMKMPLSGRPEHKRSFIPSKWDRLQVSSREISQKK